MPRIRHVNGAAIALFAAVVAGPAVEQCPGNFVPRGTDSTLKSNDQSLVTDFWRSEFLRKPENDSNQTDGAAHISNNRAAGSAAIVATNPVDLSLWSDSIVGITHDSSPETAIDVSDATELSEYETAVAHHSLSDWERAASGPVAKLEPQNGPSVVTVIVAIVGIVVVSGAYLTSAEKR